MIKQIRIPILIVTVVLLSSCASIKGPTDPQDPWERYNRSMYKFNNSVDRRVLKPVAKAYTKVVPKPINKAISNIFGNADDVIVLANDILQLKFKQTMSDLARIVYNTTFGLGGIFDVSTSMGLPKHNEDFGQTLGRWGLGSGPYFVLPLFGPSTIRDSFGLFTDFFVFDPSNLIDDFETRAYLFTLYFVDLRAGYLGTENLVEDAALDPYIFVREAFLQRRKNLIHDGKPPEDSLEDL